jgi:DNA mismatch endonuclease (patch repair protein)
MVDHLTNAQRSRAMSRVRRQNGGLEKIVQIGLLARGLRFRRHVKRLPGNPDIVFVREKIAVFVDGDFWHGWRLSKWEHKLTDFWRKKLQANRARDQRNFRQLRSAGWHVIRIWQHQLKRDIAGCLDRIERAVLRNRLLP